MAEDPKEAEPIFLAALDRERPHERAAYIEQACAGDPGLLGRVSELLDYHEGSQGPLDAPPPGLGDTLDLPPLNERPGTIIGPYKLLQQIGEGGMGVVWMAEQTEPVKRKVALKVIKPGMDSRQVIARFEAERQALALMDHVNIARVFDGGATETGRPYFVMELVHGVPITKYCDDNHLTPRERLELFVPVCQAIQHAHQKGIIHRDIKPSNVMVTLYDGKPVPKVIDFGVAKATEQKLTERTLFTQYGTMVGTLEYMSPEQAELSALGIDTRSDIYSLGVLLYELLTGSTPLTHKRMKEAAYAEILRMIKEEEPPRPSTRLSDSGEALASISANRHTEPAKLTKLVRGELDWIVMKTLEKDRNCRYETANGLAADVQRYLNDEPVKACPPSASYRFRKFTRRNKAALVTTAAVVLALVAGTVISNWQAVRATKAEGLARLRLEETEQAHKQAVAHLGRAERAERNKTEHLWDAYVEQARATRLSTSAGRRFDGLAALDRARALLPSLGSDEQRLWTLRNEMIACLVLPDLGVGRKWEGLPPGTTAVAFDATLERYARSDANGNISIRLVADDAELEQLPGPGQAVIAYGLLFSPDGRFLLANHRGSPSVAGEIRCWDWRGREKLLTPRSPVVISAPTAAGWRSMGRTAPSRLMT